MYYNCLYHCTYYCLHRKNPYIEHYDVIKVNEYMDLDKLAKVLNELITKFSGMFAYTVALYNHFI